MPQRRVLDWYKKYQDVLKQLDITDPKYIWNIDKHGSEDMPKVKKVIGVKGIKQFQKQPHEKPKQTTMLNYVNAAGFALPPCYTQGKVSWFVENSLPKVSDDEGF